MKLIFLLIIFPILILGCISQKPIETNYTTNEIELEIENKTFEIIYDEIKQTESKYDLNSIEDINQFEIFLNEYTKVLYNQTDEDSLASLHFLEFRINFLNTQKNVLMAEEIFLKDLNCDDIELIFQGVRYINNSIEYIEKTIDSVETFNNTFPEYVNKTEITEKTIEGLVLSKTEAIEIKQTFLQEIEKC